MEHRQKGVLIVGLGVILLVGLVLIAASRFNGKATPTQPMAMIESKQGASLENQPMVNNRTLSQYSFCGQVYKATPVLIGTIDVVQRITEIAAVNKNDHICENINTNSASQEILNVEMRQFPDDTDYKASDYYITVGGLRFKVDTSSDKIYVLGGFDGTPTYVGMLTKK